MLSKLQKVIAETVGDEQLTKNDLKFLKEKLLKFPPRGLADALREVFKQLPEGVVEEFNKIDSLRQIVEGLGTPSVANTIQAIVEVRNDSSHGNVSYPSDDLHLLAKILDRIVRYEFLQTVGLDRELASLVLSKN